jgi:Zn2+/Cd2+-exporting ATPase
MTTTSNINLGARLQEDRSFWLLLSAAILALLVESLDWMGFHIKTPLFGIGAAIFCLVVGRTVLKKGIKALFSGRLSSINLLVTLAAIGAFFLGEYPEACVVISLFALGEKLEDFGVESSKAALKALATRAPKQVEIKERGMLPLEEVAVGEIMLVRAGTFLGLDGSVVSGQGLVDESTLTGEAMPRAKLAGDEVYSGTQMANGFIEVKVTKVAKDSTLARIAELTAKATSEKATFQRFIERFARIYTPIVIIGSAIIFLFPVIFLNGEWRHWLEQALTLLVISCPCALVISTPISIFAAVGNAATRGILIKGGKYLETLSQVNTIVLDKTRTITIGKPVVTDVVSFCSMTQDEVLACAAGIESLSEHPLALSIVTAAKERGLKPHSAGHYETILGLGARAECYVCQDRDHFIGSKSLAVSKLSLSPEIEKAVADFSKQGKTAVLLLTEKAVEGVIALRDELKPEAIKSLESLRNLGLDLVMLTGDAKEPAEAVASEVGITKVYAGLLPQHKAERIKEMVDAGKIVVMVGDGVNDGPALAMANVGVAMAAAGSDVAIETAPVALMNDKLDLIPFLIQLSRRTWKTIRFNAYLAVVVKVAVLIFAASGHSSLTLAIVTDVGLLIFVVFFSLRLLK